MNEKDLGALKLKLQEIASNKAWTDELDGVDNTVNDYAGGNIDDAFQGGFDSGRIEMAREILESL